MLIDRIIFRVVSIMKIIIIMIMTIMIIISTIMTVTIMIISIMTIRMMIIITTIPIMANKNMYTNIDNTSDDKPMIIMNAIITNLDVKEWLIKFMKNKNTNNDNNNNHDSIQNKFSVFDIYDGNTIIINYQFVTLFISELTVNR